MDSSFTDDSESRVSSILAGTIVPTLISTCFVVARLYTRRCLSRTWALDDTLVATAWIASIGLAVLSCLTVVFGAGQHEDVLSNADLTASRKLTFANRIVYTFVVCTTKLGICSFYLRVFEDKWSKRFIYALLAFISMAALAMEFTIIFSCKPVSGIWALGVKNCLPPRPSYIANTVINTIVDLALIAFVIPKILPLKITRRQKIYIFSVVCLGFLSIFAGIFRLLSIFRYNDSPDISWQEGNITSWISIEVSTGLLCASALCLHPLIRKLFPSLASSIASTSTKFCDHPESGDIKTTRSRQQSMQSHKAAVIPHPKKAFIKRIKTGLEEVKLRTIDAKRLSRGTFAYAVRKRDDAFRENDWEDLTKGASVENWLGRTVDEEEVKAAAAIVAPPDGVRDFGSIGRSTDANSSIMSSG